jgi:hypothetical protein
VPIRTKLNSIFEAFNAAQEAKDEVRIGEGVKVSYNVPLTLAVSQCIVSVVKEQHLLTNKCLIHLIFRRLRLLQHLDALLHLYFGHSGDILTLFLQSLFNDDVESTLKDNSLSFINN